MHKDMTAPLFIILKPSSIKKIENTNSGAEEKNPMQIVTDRGADISPELAQELKIHFAPLHITLNGRTYVSGVDLQGEEFYEMLSQTDSFPTTSTPSQGDFVEIYKQLAKQGEEILSVHISSGLSGTLSAARTAAELVPEAKVTFFDSKTLSCPLGWMVEAAGRAARAGWDTPRTLQLLEKLREKTQGLFTLDSLNYLIHGGRISHLKGLLGSLLKIKPIIGVDKDSGKYITLRQDRTFGRALQGIVQVIEKWYGPGSALRIQLLHGKNPEAVAALKESLSAVFQVTWLPTLPIAPVLGAHTGPSLVGLAVAPIDVFTDIA